MVILFVFQQNCCGNFWKVSISIRRFTERKIRLVANTLRSQYCPPSVFTISLSSFFLEKTVRRERKKEACTLQGIEFCAKIAEKKSSLETKTMELGKKREQKSGASKDQQK